MSSVTSHRSVFQIEWTLENLKLFLENDSSSINEVHYGDTPLLRALRSNCHIDIVKLLLNYGANVNCKDRKGHTPLQLSLYRRNGDYINLLLEKGADINISQQFGVNLFCFALKFYYSIEIIQRLLDAGCLRSVCPTHHSVLHCLIRNRKPIWDPFVFRNILQLLIERSADVNAISSSGVSVLCSGLGNGIPASDIEALLAAGSVLNCRLHTNPLLCTSYQDIQLKEDVAQLLLNRGACVNFEVMICALMKEHNIKTIKLLLENLQSGDFTDESNNSLLHFAVSSLAVKPSVIKLLIKQGVPINSVSKRGSTALRRAVTFNKYKSARVVEILLESGADAWKESYDYLLNLAMLYSKDPNTFKLLFAYGAQITDYSLFKRVLYKYDLSPPDFNCWKELVKGHLLQFSYHGFLDLIEGNPNDCETLLWFAINCVCDYKRLSSQIVAEGRTLKEFLKGKALFQKGHGIVCEKAFFKRLFRVIAENDFSVFFNNISAKVGRSPMEIKLQELQLYAVKYYDGAPTKEKVVLNNDILYNIATFLTDEDLLGLICASYKTNDHFCAGESSQAGTHENKRSSEQSELSCKHPKLQL